MVSPTQLCWRYHSWPLRQLCDLCSFCRETLAQTVLCVTHCVPHVIVSPTMSPVLMNNATNVFYLPDLMSICTRDIQWLEVSANSCVMYYNNLHGEFLWRTLYINGLERCNPSASAMELHLSCTNPLICTFSLWLWAFHYTEMAHSQSIHDQSFCQHVSTKNTLILGLHPANERRRYFVTASLIGWAQA